MGSDAGVRAVSTLQERLRDSSGAWIHGLYDHEAADRLDELEREVEALRVDAERYRELRLGAYECVIPHGNTIDGKRTAWITKLYPGDSFDAAIDAARGKS